MTSILTEEQTLLKETAAQFFSERMPVANLRTQRDQKTPSGLDLELWREMVNLGFAGVLIPEKYSGTAFGPVGLGLILEQAGRTLAATPLISTVLLCGSAIQLAGTGAQRQKFLPQIAAGEYLLSLALEEGPHHNPAHIGTRAVSDGNGYLITGNKTFILDGHIADYLIVAARTSGETTDRNGITLFILAPGKTDGLRITRTHMADNRNAANIALQGVHATDADILGSVGGGTDVLDQMLDIGRIGLAAELLGLTQEVFDRTLAYLKERRQFETPIGSFQALKHRAAQMFCEIEICRSIVLDALTAIEQHRDDIPQLASLAKAKLSDTARLVTNECLQMHGGIGMTDEVDIGLFMKRARVAAATLGDSNFHRDRYAALEDF